MPVNLGLGKDIKNRMREKFRIHFEQNEAAWLEGTISASQRRILDATWLDESFKEFLAEGGQRKVNDRSKSLCVDFCENKQHFPTLKTPSFP